MSSRKWQQANICIILYSNIGANCRMISCTNFWHRRQNWKAVLLQTVLFRMSSSCRILQPLLAHHTVKEQPQGSVNSWTARTTASWSSVSTLSQLSQVFWQDRSTFTYCFSCVIFLALKPFSSLRHLVKYLFSTVKGAILIYKQCNLWCQGLLSFSCTLFKRR